MLRKIFKFLLNLFKKIIQMAKQVIGIGSSYDDPTADPIRDGFYKCNDNFTELYDSCIKFALGNWDMDTEGEITVPLSVDGTLFDVTNCSFSVMILDDAGELIRDFNIGGIATLSDFDLTLQRTESGFFDSASYNASNVNRGYLYIYKHIG